MSVTAYKIDKSVFVRPTGSGHFAQLENYLNLKEYITDVVEEAEFTSLEVDTISEKTAGNGVAVDGTTLKDGGVLMDDGTVTQLTSITTGVTLNKPAGVITTVSSNLAAGAFAVFTVTNSFAAATSVIISTIVNYSGAVDGSAGQPEVLVDNRGAGSFDIVLFNSDATQALNGTVSIAFAILG